MLVGIEGIIERKEPTFLHINVNGLTYEVLVSLNTSSTIKTEEVKLFLSQIIREDAQILVGFLEKEEQKIFDTLLKINGVGAKVALAVCSTFTPSRFAEVISSKDVNMLKKVPGIGPKSAGRILIELEDFIFNNPSISTNDNSYSDAILALESLGFKKDAIQKAIKGCKGDTSSLVKQGLKNLQKA